MYWFQKGWSVPESDDLSLLEMTSPAKTATLVTDVSLAQIKLIAVPLRDGSHPELA